MSIRAGTGHQLRALQAAVILALLVATAILLAVRGSGDIGIWERWTNNALRAGVVEGFRENDNDYPPLSNVVLWITGHTAAAAGLPQRTAIKISLVIFLAITLVAFYAWSGRARLTLGLWAAVVLNAVGMGYLDIYAMPPLIFSLWALQQSRSTAAVTWFCVACLVKWQPAIIGPFVLLHVLLALGPLSAKRWQSYLRLVAPALLLVGLAVLVFQPYPLFRAFGKSLGHRILSGDTLNLPWIATWILQSIAKGMDGVTGQVTALANAPLAWRLLFKILFACQFFGLIVRFVKGPMRFERTLAYSFVGFLGYVTIASGVHENHWFVPGFLAISLVGLRRAWLLPAVAVSVMANVNLLLFYGWTGRGLDVSRVIGIDVSVPLAAAGVAMYIWIWRTLGQMDRRGWDHAGLIR